MRRYLTFPLGPPKVYLGRVPKEYAGKSRTVEHMVALIRAGARDSYVRQKALDILLERRVNPKDYLGEIKALFEWVQQNIRYTKDPFRPEVLHSVRRMLELRAGDCDDMAILLGAMWEATGHPVRLVLAGPDPLRPHLFTHVYLEVYCKGCWIPLDLTIGLPRSESADTVDEHGMLQEPAGCVLEQPSAPLPPGMLGARGHAVVVTGPFGEPQVRMAVPMQPSFNGTPFEMVRRRPISWTVPVATPQVEPERPLTVRGLRPVWSGQAYRVTSLFRRGLVTPELAEALESVFERFAHERGFTPGKPLEVCLSHGLKARSHGHREGRAADIAAVGGKSLLEWKQEWDRAMAIAVKLADPQWRAEAIAAEQKRNLGYGLYKALQAHGGWLVDPKSWRPYRGVMQLFGPWTATEGPWKPMQIKAPNPYQRQRLADQQWVFHAHRDHIHVAK